MAASVKTMFTTPERDTPDHNATVERLKDVRFLFVDEISMVSGSYPHFLCTTKLTCYVQVSAELLCAIDKRLRIAHAALSNIAENELPDFGLANVIVLGDFAYVRLHHCHTPAPCHHQHLHLSFVRQFRPIAATWLGAAGPSAHSKNKGWAGPGLLLWKHFTSVVLLTENYRQKHDPKYARFLIRVRNGTVRQKDVAYIQPRIMGLPSTDPTVTYDDPLWRGAPHLFSRNDVIAQHNVQASRCAAQDLQVPPVVVWALDMPERGAEPLTLVARSMLPHYRPKSVTVQPGVLLLYPGQKLRVQAFTKQSSVTGLVNGATATLVRIVYNTDESSAATLDPATARELDCMPQCLILKLDKPGLKPLAIPGLGPGEFMIKPVTNKFTFKQDPKDFGVGVRRLMFPVEHAAAMSEFKASLLSKTRTHARARAINARKRTNIHHRPKVQL